MGVYEGKTEEQLYERGFGYFSAGDYGHGTAFLLELAKRGHYGAQYCMGIMHHRGFGYEATREDLDQAEEYLRASAGQGCREAADYLERHFDAPRREAERKRAWEALPEEEKLYRQGKEAYEKQDLPLAAWYFDQAARLGLGNAQYEMGELYRLGLGVEQSEANALYWYQTAAEQGHEAARKAVARIEKKAMGEEEEAVSGNEEENQQAKDDEDDTGLCPFRKPEPDATYMWPAVIELLKKETEETIIRLARGNTAAGMDAYDKGDLAEAMKCAEIGAQLGCPEGQRFLAHLFWKGEDGNRNENRARIWMRRAAMSGLETAVSDLRAMEPAGGITAEGLYQEGIAYINENDYEHGIPLLEEAAFLGDKGAQCFFGIMLTQDKEGSSAGIARGVAYMEMGAKDGKPEAQWYLGTLYYRGEVVEKDCQKAAYWFERGARAGDVKCQSYLGRMLAMGEGVKQDYKRAFYWLEKSAASGDKDAQRSLGGLYLVGEGVDQDTEKAKDWLQKAAAQGDLLAKKIFEEAF